MFRTLHLAEIMLLAFLMGCCGWVTLLLILRDFGGMTNAADLGAASAMGAAIGGVCVSPLIGREGVTGWGCACLAGCLATVIGASLAITFFGIFSGTMNGIGGGIVFAPVLVFGLLLQDGIALMAWGAMMAGIHLLVRRRRASQI